MKMTDLHKAAEMALESWDFFFSQAHPGVVDLMYGNEWARIAKERTEALRQALAMEKFSKVNQEIEEALKQPQQEPVAWVYNGILHEFDPSEFATSEVKPLYTAPPISDYHEGWEEGFKAATREQEPVAYVTIEPALDGDWRKCPSIKWFKKPTEGPLYTAPPKREWVGLEDEDVATVKNEFNRGALWAEQVLKEKNT